MSGEQRGTVLVIDDDQDMRWALSTILAQTGIEVAEVSAGAPERMDHAAGLTASAAGSKAAPHHRLLMALADGDEGTARALAGDMEAALGATLALVPEHRIMAHFDLARFWSQRRDVDRAFPHWIEGHRLLCRMQPFSRAATRAFHDAMIARFDHLRFSAGLRAQNRDNTPVFVVGMPRSGTTLAEQIIAAHKQAFGAGERVALGRAFTALGGGDTAAAAARIAALDQAGLDHAAAASTCPTTRPASAFTNRTAGCARSAAPRCANQSTPAASVAGGPMNST